MIRILSSTAVKEFIDRKELNTQSVEEIVSTIIADVKERGDKALIDYAQRFDKAILTSIKVTEEEFKQAEKQVSKEYKEMLKRACENSPFLNGCNDNKKKM